MASLNKVLLIGNLTRDPEVRYTPKGTAVCTLGLAVNERYTTGTGEQKEETIFVDVDVWGRTAEIAGQYLSKGRPVFIEGRLKLDQWDDKETGQKRSKLKVVGLGVQFLGPPKGGEFKDEAPAGGERAATSRSSAPRRPASPAAQPGPGAEEAPPVDDDNIPF
jgi:single-strand DNA-binding protein